MINILDVIYSIVKQFKICMPTSKHYLGRLPENHQAPCFLYMLVFNGDKGQTKYVKDTTIDLQIIYFGVNDGYGGTDYEDKLKTIDSLKNFLSTFLLKVADRSLKFDYNFGDADDQLTVNMQFKFKDGVVNIDEVYDMMESIVINGEEVQ